MPGDTPDEQVQARLRKVRHDLSNPLAAILAEAQLLLLSPEQFNRESLDGLKQIETLARRMRQILDDATV
ncbi:MAG TPA: histidine kinase dimerization/phospho-acceptor domain-containing protein [Gemmatimonadales bacterium]|nr:histidine kinase dimerization/phospho-acceptor domain-containing protein [Gemmatimonadales bacterium]